MTQLLKTIPDQKTLFLTEIFSSVQGETSLTGYPTTFIRLSACNLRCVWCDTTYSFKRGKAFTLEEIMVEVRNNANKYVLVTGGEPLLQENVYLLFKMILDEGYIVSLETSGSLSTNKVDPRIITILDVKCPGSGMSDKNDWSNLYNLKAHDEVKFVIADLMDYRYAKNICEKYELFKKNHHVLFSPVFSKLESKELVNWILQDKLPVRLNLQIHKFIWDPGTKGV